MRSAVPGPLIIDRAVIEGRIKILGDPAGGATAALDHHQIGVAVRVPAHRRRKRDRPPVWRPGGWAGDERLIGETSEPLRGQIEHPDVIAGPGPPVLDPVGGEGDASTVGREGRRAVVPIAVGELLGLAAVAADSEEMRTPFVDPALAVQTSPESVDSADGGHPLLVQAGVLRLRIIRLTDLCRVNDDVAVRRPGGIAGAPSRPGELACFIAICRQQPELWLPHTAIALRLVFGFDLARRGADKDERPAVGRPSGGRVVVAGRVAAGRPRRRRGDPDRAVIFVARTVDLDDDVGDPFAVGGDLRIFDELDGVQVVRFQSACHWLPPSWWRRSQASKGPRGRDWPWWAVVPGCSWPPRLVRPDLTRQSWPGMVTGSC